MCRLLLHSSGTSCWLQVSGLSLLSFQHLKTLCFQGFWWGICHNSNCFPSTSRLSVFSGCFQDSSWIFFRRLTECAWAWISLVLLSHTSRERWDSASLLQSECASPRSPPGCHSSINTQKREREVKFLVMCGLYWNTGKDDIKVTGQRCGSSPPGPSDGTQQEGRRMLSSWQLELECRGKPSLSQLIFSEVPLARVLFYLIAALWGWASKFSTQHVLAWVGMKAVCVGVCVWVSNRELFSQTFPISLDFLFPTPHSKVTVP